MDKRVYYALVGGVAIVSAAVAFHFLSRGTEEADDGLDDELAALGPLELDAYGRIEFEQYLKIFKICAFYGKS